MAALATRESATGETIGAERIQGFWAIGTGISRPLTILARPFRGRPPLPPSRRLRAPSAPETPVAAAAPRRRSRDSPWRDSRARAWYTPPMEILMVAAELSPYARAGETGDSVAA